MTEMERWEAYVSTPEYQARQAAFAEWQAGQVYEDFRASETGSAADEWLKDQAYNDFRARESADGLVAPLPLSEIACTPDNAQVIAQEKDLLDRVTDWAKSPATWWGIGTEDETVKILEEADNIPLYLPLIKGANPQFPNIKAPTWYLEKYGIQSADDLVGPLKTILVDGKTIRGLGRAIGDITVPWTLGIGLALTIAPNIVANIREKKPWNDTVIDIIADVIVDTGGFFVSEIVGTVAGIIALNSGIGTPFAFAIKIGADVGISVAWDTAADKNNWSERVRNWLDSAAQDLAHGLDDSFTDALDVSKHPPVPTPSPSQPTTTPSPSLANPVVIPTQAPSPVNAPISTVTPPP
ncbi:MAG: hypothetical protein IT310_03200 [Anaerolineales bacterium]|nr:hypothetical protein [Anaerolineales bacterium]